MKQNFLECGRVINKRGINGELKLECYCDSPASIKNVKVLYTDNEGKTALNVISLKEYKGFIYLKLEGIDCAEKADELRGQVIYISREDVSIDDNRDFIADLIGLEVRDCDSGIVYGKISDVLNFGASDIYVVKNGKNEYMLPAVDDIIVEKNLDSHILVKPIHGIFDEAEEIRS